MILKSYIVEQNVNLLNNYQATLIYGPNNGIKDDIKQELKNINKDKEIIFFLEEEIIRNKNIIYKNIVNESLFNEKKIIFLHEVSDKIFDQIFESLQTKKGNVKIFIFSGVLEKKSKLRNLFEKDENLAIFACYEDNERTLINYINRELKNIRGLSGEIVNLIISNSNMDRRIIRNELIKIKDFFLEKKINKEEILELLNIKINNNFDKIRDSALKGDKSTINQLLSEVDLLNEDAFFYLNSLNYRILKLKDIIKINADNENGYEQIIESIKPPIFWKDKPVFAQQLKKWNLKKIDQLVTHLVKTEVLMKKNSYLRNDIIIKDLIINVVNKASTTFS